MDRPPTLLSTRQSVYQLPADLPPSPQSQSRISVSIHPDTQSTVFSLGPAQNPEGILRPVIGIDRYAKHTAVVVEKQVYTYILRPVTTEFVRSVFCRIVRHLARTYSSHQQKSS